MNKIFFDGRVVRDPELRYISTGTALLSFSIANDVGFKDNKKTNFFDCDLWGKKAEGLADYITKGKPLIIVGEVTTDTWDDRETGKKRYKQKVRVTEISFMMQDKDQQPATRAVNDPPRQKPDLSGTAFGEDSTSDPELYDDAIPF